MAIWSNQPQLLELGCEYAYYTSSWNFFPRQDSRYLYDTPFFDIVERNLNRARVNHGPIVINIEHWSFTGGRYDAAPEETRLKLTELVRWVKELHPKAKIGFYGYLPVRNYYAPINYSKKGGLLEISAMDRWRQQTLENIKWMGELFDWAMPSIYHVLNKSDANWVLYADFQIDLASRSSLPVAPFVSYQRHGQEALTLKEWSLQCEFIKHKLEAGVITDVFLWGRDWPSDILDVVKSTLL